MALETDVLELPIAQGQNEGTERALLPAGQFSYVQNARFRKNMRLGKRNGYTSVSSLDAAGNALGNGSGRLACLGPSFCVVDDRFYPRDQVSGTWRLPPASFDSGATAGTRLYGRFPQFMPGAVIETLPVQSDLNLGAYTGTSEPSIGGITYGLGYIWTCCSFFSAQAATWLIQVCALDPTTRQVVHSKTVNPITTTPATVRQQPVLLTTGDGNTIVLIYDVFTAGVKSGVRVRTLTSLTGGWSNEVSFACVQSAANYDPTTASGILFVYTLTGSPTSYTVARMNPTTMTASASGTRALGGAKTRLSCFCNATGQVWVGLTDASDGLRSHAWNAALAFQGASADWTGVYSDAVGPILFAGRTSSSVCAIADSSDAAGGLCVFDLSSSGTTSGRLRQFSCKALSQPFTIGGQVFLWVRHYADAQLGVATLVRVPLGSVGDEYANNAVSPYTRSLPIEATLDDWDIDAPVAIGPSGPVFPTPISTPLGYVTLLNPTRETLVANAATTQLRGFLVVPVWHRSTGLRYSPSCVVPCSGKHFVAGAQPMWVDALGAYEGGFIQAPVVTSVASGTGGLTSGIAYAYSAVYYSIDGNGLIERSAPSVPFDFDTTAGGSTEQTVSISVLGLSSRPVVRVELYRTTANAASTFQLINSVDATPGSSVTATVTFVDDYADSDVEQNKTLYTQVGQELATSQFPSCSFANTGGNRLWCAGGFNGNVWHASKLFVPGVCAEFADDDAFRGQLPEDITGSAWLDAQVFFTQEGIYRIDGDGPDGAGVGYFVTTRLPFNIGCIDWRSVAATDIGIFFQSARGLYLLPRGFGEPVAMDQVLDTLTTYPIITSARADFRSRGGADSSEQVVQWTAVSDEAATTGVVITYDIAYKAFYVDTCRADYPATFQSGWLGDAVQAPATMTVGPNGAGNWHPFRVRDTGYDDGGLAIEMRLVTGDVRPWGMFNHGVINRAGLLGELRSACTVAVERTTDRGTGHTAQRVYTAAGTAGQPAAGDDIYLEVPLGHAEKRDVTALRVGVEEDSAVEGVALFGLVIEKDRKPQGFKLLGPADRVQ